MKFAKDITLEKNLQIETEQQQAEIKSHLETINKTIATLEFDMEGEISYVNQVFLDISGYTEDELIGKRYEYLLPPEEVDKPQTAMMWMSLRDGNHFTGQFRQKSKSGKELWLSGTFNPILNQGGEPQKVMMFAQFNTTEKEQQNDLAQSMNAVKNTVLVMELNEEGFFKNGNELFFRETGYKRLELRKKSIDFLLKDAMSNREITHLMNKLRKHEFLESNIVITTKGGVKKIYRATFSPIKSLEHELKRTLVLLIDQSSVLSISAN